LVVFALVFVQIILYTKDVIGGELMPLKFKINVLDALKQAGYNTSRIRQENLLSQSTLQKLRDGGQLSWSNLETICRLLECQPGDILEYIPFETE
jgi:putative transcriptional regulator